MSAMLNTDYTPSKVIGIQFGILSPDDIRNASVAEKPCTRKGHHC